MSWKREPLTEDELSELLEHAEGARLQDETTVRVLAHTGLRADELAHLSESWLDWQAERIRVPESSGDWSPKSSSSIRTIPVKDPRTIRVLRDFFKRRDTYGATRMTVYRRVKTVADETTIRKKITPHVLRHTYGTTIARRGASAQYIRQTMGHADLSSANTYIQFTGRELDAEAERLW